MGNLRPTSGAHADDDSVGSAPSLDEAEYDGGVDPGSRFDLSPRKPGHSEHGLAPDTGGGAISVGVNLGAAIGLGKGAAFGQNQIAFQ
jgi:hypothetical protein